MPVMPRGMRSTTHIDRHLRKSVCAFDSAVCVNLVIGRLEAELAGERHGVHEAQQLGGATVPETDHAHVRDADAAFLTGSRRSRRLLR